jgi:hypothetical protein
MILFVSHNNKRDLDNDGRREFGHVVVILNMDIAATAANVVGSQG